MHKMGPAATGNVHIKHQNGDSDFDHGMMVGARWC